MAQDLSASAAAASLPSPPLSDQEHPSLPRSYVGTCYNTVLTHSTIGPRAGASDTKDMTNSLHGSLYYCIKNRRVKPAVCYLNEKPILYVNSHGYYSHKCELEDHYSVYEDSDMLCISVRTTGDGGTYTVHTDRKTSTFKHQKSKELAEPTETCRPQNCSHESCSCCVISTMAQGEDRVESPMLQVKESSWKELELLNCVGENLVSNESVTITTPRVLHSGESWAQAGERWAGLMPIL
ncbi:uncharacterized protein LOC134429227 [Melospiza melodia melodia]|uniref:uncharacterized protein LOC134429227 n=1 Tax=Melospiza melodia melodia TaxID=1914991 RepID=UPI002FD3718D